MATEERERIDNQQFPISAGGSLETSEPCASATEVLPCGFGLNTDYLNTGKSLKMIGEKSKRRRTDVIRNTGFSGWKTQDETREAVATTPHTHGLFISSSF